MMPDPSTVLPVGASPTLGSINNPTSTYQNLTGVTPSGTSIDVPSSVPSNSLQPTTPITTPIPTTPNLSTGLFSSLGNDVNKTGNEANINTETVKSGITDYSNLLAQLTGKTPDTQQLQNDYGTVALTKRIGDLNATASQQQALYLQGVQNLNNKNISQGERGQAEVEATRQHGIDSLLTSSLISASQNQLTTANTQIERALALKYDPIVARIDAQSKILSQNINLMSASNQKLAAAKLAQNEALKQQVTNEQAMKKDAITAANTAITNGTIDQTQGYQAISDLANGKSSLADFYSKLGIQPTSSIITTSVQGTVAQRNNNPGNLKDPSTGAFRTFSTPEQGFQALQKDLLSKMTGATSTGLTANSSLLDFAKVYAPSSDNNNPTQYAQNLATQLGVPTDTKIGTLVSRVNDVARAIAQNEGFNNPTVNQYGKLAQTDFNPASKTDARANLYLETLFNKGVEPTNASLGIMARTAGGTVQFQLAHDRAAQLYYQATGNPLPNVADIKNAQTLINANNKLANNLNIQEGTIGKNFALAIKNLDTNNLNQASQPINAFIDNVKNLLGDPNVAQYLAQNITVSNELGSLLAVKNASGTTVADKLESSKLVKPGASEAQQQAVLKVLLQEAENAQSAIKQTSGDLYKITDPLARNANNPERQKLINPEGTDQTNIDAITKFRASSPENDAHATALRAQFPNASPTQIRQALNLPAYE